MTPLQALNSWLPLESFYNGILSSSFLQKSKPWMVVQLPEILTCSRLPRKFSEKMDRQMKLAKLPLQQWLM
jgi:hypothetical protein